MNQENNENTSFHDDAPSDKGMNKFLQEIKEKGPDFGTKMNRKMLRKKIDEDSGEVYSRNLMDDDFQSEEDFEEDFDPDNDDDFVVKE